MDNGHDMTPMTEFDEVSLPNFHSYIAFTRMSVQIHQTVIVDNTADRCIIKLT